MHFWNITTKAKKAYFDLLHLVHLLSTSLKHVLSVTGVYESKAEMPRCSIACVLIVSTGAILSYCISLNVLLQFNLT